MRKPPGAVVRDWRIGLIRKKLERLGRVTAADCDASCLDFCGRARRSQMHKKQARPSSGNKKAGPGCAEEVWLDCASFTIVARAEAPVCPVADLLVASRLVVARDLAVVVSLAPIGDPKPWKPGKAASDRSAHQPD